MVVCGWEVTIGKEESVEILEAIQTRRSIRAFRPDPVRREVLEELLDVCRWAPSARNAQPWHFAVLGGTVLDEVKARLNEKVRTSWDGKSFTDRAPDIPRTAPYPDCLLPRMEALRRMVTEFMLPPGTESNEEIRAEYRARSQRFHDAPNAIVIYCDDPSVTVMGSVGIITQTICLAALSFGLGTCIMGGAVMWPDIYRDLLGIPEGKPLPASIGIGYPDDMAPINTFERVREPLETLAEWHGL